MSPPVCDGPCQEFCVDHHHDIGTGTGSRTSLPRLSIATAGPNALPKSPPTHWMKHSFEDPSSRQSLPLKMVVVL